MKMLDFPRLRQTFSYDCGAQALHCVLAYYGVDVHEIEVIKIAGTSRRGTPVNGFARVAGHFGLKCGIRRMTAEEIKKLIGKGIPVILMLQAWPGKKIKDWKTDWQNGHYVVAIGYDRHRVYFEDPYSMLRTYLSFKELEERWHDQDLKKKYDHYGIIITGKRRANLEKKIHMG